MLIDFSRCALASTHVEWLSKPSNRLKIKNSLVRVPAVEKAISKKGNQLGSSSGCKEVSHSIR